MNRRDVLALAPVVVTGFIARAAISIVPAGGVVLGEVASRESMAFARARRGAGDLMLLADREPTAALDRMTDLWREDRLRRVSGLTGVGLWTIIERLAIDLRLPRKALMLSASGTKQVLWVL